MSAWCHHGVRKPIKADGAVFLLVFVGRIQRVLLRFHPLQCDLLALLSHLDHKLIRDQSPGSSELSTEFRRDALVLDLISPDEGIVILGDECRMVANLSQAEKQRKHMVVVLENRASS